jgi:hypothetical protein
MNWKTDFNWAGAIQLNREALNRIVAALFALLGLDGEAPASRILPPYTGPRCRCCIPPNPPCGA